jgi:hypothetical protein
MAVDEPPYRFGIGDESDDGDAGGWRSPFIT